MTMFNREEFDTAIDAYLDGDLAAPEARRLEAFAEIDENAARELRFARLVQQRLHAMPQPACPPDVTRAVLSMARAEAREGFFERLRTAAILSWSTILRPSLAVGVLIGVIVAGALIGRSPVDETQIAASEGYEATPEEIAQGLNDAKWALAYLSDVGRRTATTIRDDVLDQHVVQPVNRALNAAFDDDQNIQ